ncbi:WD40-repeat-containing domain protein [Rhodotorula diobovata]|uniref:WD40-repeat-containing domain protein n=1 Tax=Rhodotorula diobovata TaxID=5288 RepID=A0A5C5G089_9BASI|nr:WD40-repeat-containing domain protein [Rhodotorula diobovata]
MSTPGPPAGAQSTPDANYRAILDYLAKRGHHKAALALSADLEGSLSRQGTPAPGPGPVPGGGKAVPLDDFAERNAPSAPRQPSAPPGQQPQQQGQGQGQGQGQVRRRMDQSVAPGHMLADPPSWDKGYAGLRLFVENSLDIHRPELSPLLLPLFVHSYLDLVLVGYRDAADHFLARFAPDHAPLYPGLVRLLASLRLPSHVAENEQALRWRHERYHVRLSERGWGLLLGWLQGGGLHGSSEGTEGRGRDRVLAIINERVKVDDYASLSRGGAPPAPYGADGTAPELRLGPGRVNPQLEREVRRRLKDAGEEEDDAVGEGAGAKARGREDKAGGADGEGAEGAGGGAADSAGDAAGDGALERKPTLDAPSSSSAAAAANDAKAASTGGSTTDAQLISPFPAELPPYPSTFRTLDVAREVERVREARKRIRLGPEAYAPEGALIPATRGEGGGALGAGLLGERGAEGRARGAREDQRRGVGKPSVCLFTLHDTGDSLSTVTFSEDSTVMATGFTESYIRLWSLDGKGLRALRTDLKEDEVDKIRDANDLSKLYHPDAPQTRKLIAHSGPVYSLSFDPVPGPASPPRYLLSASADTTVRLWSLETYANLVVYRGHREPVWAVEWGPRGVYFATASRDRTARLWITDKVNAVRIFAGHLSDVNCLSFHPNSLYLATGSSDRTCRLWDVQKGHCVRVFIGHRAAVQVVRCSPDGRYLASAGDDGLVLLWSLATGLRIKTFHGHTAPINSLAFSNESTVLVSGAADDTVRVWDVATPPGEGANPSDVPSAQGAGGTPDLLATLATKRTPVLEVKFTPRNLCLAAGAMREAAPPA